MTPNKLLTLLRFDRSSLGIGRLVSLLELLLLFKLRGGMGGLVLTGLKVKLCLVNIFIPGEALFLNPVPSRPAVETRTR